MDRKRKKTYESPTIEVVEVKSEQILCGSNNPLFTIGVISGMQYSNPFTGGGEDW